MNFWRGGFIPDLLLIVALIAVAAQLRRAFPLLARLGVPDALLAGLLGMSLGPGGLDVLPFDAANLELVVYHGLAIIFITVALQAPPEGRSPGARSLAFVIPSMAVIQALLGLSVVLAWNVVNGPTAVHPGTGLMVPLGFSQGPGPAMVFGDTWSQKAGMVDGAQIGLIMAALGFAWCTVGGVGLLAYGRRKGWDVVPAGEADDATPDAPRPGPRSAEPGQLEPMSAQFVTVAIVYLATYLFLDQVSPLLPEKHRPTIWGFHFLIALGLGLATRGILRRTKGNPLDDDLLARMSSVTVDLATACALAAVQLAVLGKWLLPLLTISGIAGFATLVLSVWVARRAFPRAPLEHAVMLYGAQTGTATTGLALLRILDPELRGPAARNFVLASAGAAMLGLPLFIMMQKPVTGWPDTYPGAPLMTMGLLAIYLVVVLTVARRATPLRFLRPFTSLWPDRPKD